MRIKIIPKEIAEKLVIMFKKHKHDIVLSQNEYKLINEQIDEQQVKKPGTKTEKKLKQL